MGDRSGISGAVLCEIEARHNSLMTCPHKLREGTFFETFNYIYNYRFRNNWYVLSSWFTRTFAKFGPKLLFLLRPVKSYRRSPQFSIRLLRARSAPPKFVNRISFPIPNTTQIRNYLFQRYSTHLWPFAKPSTLRCIR